MINILKMLRIAFDPPIESHQIPKFRKSILQKVGHLDLFHNHLRDRYHYRYPLVQYKIVKIKEGFYPAVLCLNHAVEQAPYLFSDSQYFPGPTDMLFRVKPASIKLIEHKLQFLPKPTTFSIYNWQALNSKNFEEWKRIEGKDEEYKTSFLEKILVGNFLSFAKGTNWRIDDRIQIKILDKPVEKTVIFKNLNVKVFTVKFNTNISIPEYVGLGKGCSIGFGTVRKISREANETNFSP